MKKDHEQEIVLIQQNNEKEKKLSESDAIKAIESCFEKTLAYNYSSEDEFEDCLSFQGSPQNTVKSESLQFLDVGFTSELYKEPRKSLPAVIECSTNMLSDMIKAIAQPKGSLPSLFVTSYLQRTSIGSSKVLRALQI